MHGSTCVCITYTVLDTIVARCLQLYYCYTKFEILCTRKLHKIGCKIIKIPSHGQTSYCMLLYVAN